MVAGRQEGPWQWITIQGKPAQKKTDSDEACWNREVVYRALAERHSWGPEQVAQLTLPQQLAYMVDDETITGRKNFATMTEYKRWLKTQGNE